MWRASGQVEAPPLTMIFTLSSVILKSLPAAAQREKVARSSWADIVGHCIAIHGENVEAQERH